MKELINKIPPKYRRWLVVGVSVLAFSLIMTIAGSITGGDDDRRQDPEENRVQNILTDRDTSGARLERLQAEIENINEEREDLAQEVDRLNRSLNRREEQGENAEMEAQISELQNAIDTLTQEGVISRDPQTGEIEIGDRITDPPAPQSSPDDESAPMSGEQGGETGSEPQVQIDPNQPAYQRQLDQLAQEDDPMWQQPQSNAGGSSSGFMAPPGSSAGNQTGQSASGEEGESQAPQSAIRTINSGGELSQNDPEGEQQSSIQSGGEQTEGSADGEDEGSVYIPTGSIITGTLITGMDAPTGQQARQDPHPALLRIKREAILPNRFRADIRECFVLMGGRGSLSSERAYLRGETISCVREDGGVVEASLNSYTVGEDGKAGVRGRLVSKQGQFLARALMAGFLESFANAFDQTPVPSIDIAEQGDDEPTEQIYQQAFSGEALQSATVSGAGKAMDRLAQFYIDQAQGLFPIIEVDAGREVEIVLISGTDLQIR